VRRAAQDFEMLGVFYFGRGFDLEKGAPERVDRS